MFSGFIFDVEGTLVDCVPQTLKSLQEALERFGHEVPYNTLQLYSGLDGDQTLQLLCRMPTSPNGKISLRCKVRSMKSSIFMAWRPLMVFGTYFVPSFSRVVGSRSRPTAMDPR